MVRKLTEIGDTIKYLKHDIKDALSKVEELADWCGYGWIELNKLERRLSQISKWIDVVVPKDIELAINKARDEQDRLADEQDAMSY